jgi:hypothetical protein
VVRVHGPGEHALELECLDLTFKLSRIAADLGDRSGLRLEFREFQQLKRALNRIPNAIEPRRDRLELRALLA